MQSKLLFSFIIFSIVSLPALGQIYKWVDDKGHVHYGDKAPGSSQKKAENVSVNVNVVHSDTKFKFAPGTTQHRRKHKTQSDVTVVSSGKRKAPEADCKAEWARYRKSKACFDACGTTMVRREYDGYGYHYVTSGRNNAGCKCEDVKAPMCSL